MTYGFQVKSDSNHKLLSTNEGVSHFEFLPLNKPDQAVASKQEVVDFNFINRQLDSENLKNLPSENLSNLLAAYRTVMSKISLTSVQQKQLSEKMSHMLVDKGYSIILPLAENVVKKSSPVSFGSSQLLREYLITELKTPVGCQRIDDLFQTLYQAGDKSMQIGALYRLLVSPGVINRNEKTHQDLLASISVYAVLYGKD